MVDLPLAGGDLVGIEVSLLEASEPELRWGSRVAVGGAEDDLEAEMLVARPGLVALVVGGLHEQ